MNGEDEECCTALHRAAAAGRLQAAELLIEHGALVDAQSADESTPLHKCVGWETNVELVALLVRHGANVNARVRHGFSCLPRHSVPYCLLAPHTCMHS